MRLRNIPGAEEEMLVNPFVVQNPEQYKGQWNKEFFQNDHPIHMEIGTGKGQFITELALRNPDINYIGVEKFSSVLLRAVQKHAELDIPNLFFLRFDAEWINEVFGENEISKLYLNFSDPWPKDRHHKRRLTSREFLSRYTKFLKPGATLEFKTDNVGLFDFSLEEIEASGWDLRKMTRDLHRDSIMNEGNIMTEYEEKFSILGNKIMKLIASPKQEEA